MSKNPETNESVESVLSEEELAKKAQLGFEEFMNLPDFIDVELQVASDGARLARIRRDSQIIVRASWGKYYVFQLHEDNVMEFYVRTYSKEGDAGRVNFGYWSWDENEEEPRAMAISADGSFVNGGIADSPRDIWAKGRITHFKKMLEFGYARFGNKRKGILPTNHELDQKLIIKMLAKKEISVERANTLIDRNFENYLTMRDANKRALKARRDSFKG